MNKELKRQIKEDELVSGVEKAWGWAHARQEQLRIGAVALVVLLVGAAAFSWFRATRAHESEAAFSEALATFHATVQAAPPVGAPPPSGPSFSSAQEKYTKALAQFDGVAARWGSLPQGRRAKYYAALCRLQLGQHDPARQALAELAKGGDPAVAVQARLSLAEALAHGAEVDKAVDTLRELADDPQVVVPRDYVLMTLAATLEDARRSDEAGKAYERVAQEFPEGPFAAEARRRADYLKNVAS